MRYFYFAAVSFFLATLAPIHASAADANGYTAKYECRAGGPNCNVDVAALTARQCDQVIGTSTSWSSINWSNRTICLAAGDHTAKGTLTIPSSASGSSSSYKVLKFENASAKPWTQSSSARARVKRIILSGADYWLITHLVIDGDGASTSGLLEFTPSSGANYNIIHRVLIEDGNSNGIRVGPGNNANTIQNSVIRNCRYNPGNDYAGVSHDGGPTNTHIVNNEMYGCNKGVYVSEHQSAGTVVENNDLYVPTSMYTDCAGNYNGTGPCSATEGQIGFKNAGTSSNPVRILHNRVWGNRPTDTGVCCNSGGQGVLIYVGGATANTDPAKVGSKYTLVMNNILMDSQQGLAGYWDGVRNNSYVGNIVYKINRYNSKYMSFAINSGANKSSEWYFNTIVDAYAWDHQSSKYGGTNNDMRCNVIINSGKPYASPGTSTQLENNAFFATAAVTTASAYSDVLGTSASAAQNESYCFYRKLQTSAERVCIPNVKPTASSPHRSACAATVGQRAGIGINDQPLF